MALVVPPPPQATELRATGVSDVDWVKLDGHAVDVAVPPVCGVFVRVAVEATAVLVLVTVGVDATAVLVRVAVAVGGASGHTFSYSFNLAAGQTAVVVVVEVSPNLGCANYTLNINPCAPPLLTPTITPGAATSTSTRTPLPVTPSATPTTSCLGTTYQLFPSSGATLIPATNKIANECDDCVTLVNLHT